MATKKIDRKKVHALPLWERSYKVAQAIGISRFLIYEWQNGKNLPSVKNAAGQRLINREQLLLWLDKTDR